MIRPPRLRAGDVIGIAAPSSPTAAVKPRRLERGVRELERRGFRVRLGEHVRNPQPARSERISELHELFADPEVRAIVCTTGGSDSHQLLEGLDYDLIAANPKPFVGYSDVSAVQVAVWVRTGLAVAMGPALLSQFAEFGGIDDYAWRSWERTLMRAEPAGAIDVSPEWWHERLEWDISDDRPRPREPNPGPRAVRPGAGSQRRTSARCSCWRERAGGRS